MSQDNGDPRFQGAVPLGEPSAMTQMIRCTWHEYGITHPPGAPTCIRHEGTEQQVIPLGVLIEWVVANLTHLMRATSGMGLRVEEIAVQLEALDATLSE